MSDATYSTWVGYLQQLATAVQQLDPLAEAMGLEPAYTQSWHGELVQKLLPQIAGEPVLIVAVVGGTNTGKSTLFNYLAGAEISRTSAYATFTRHPVCLVPTHAAQTLNLSELFAGFRLVPWHSADDAIADGPDNLLVVREDPQAHRLLLLDTPDMNSIQRDNWARAEHIRNAADVLICNLTAETYAEHAILQFLQPAARSDKTFIVVFNKLDLPDDHEHFTAWLQPLATDAGVTPHYVYGVRRDREAAASNQIQVESFTPGATDLRHDLSQLKFAEIKLRSIQGSVRQLLDDTTGAPAFFRQVARTSDEYAHTRELLRQAFTPTITPPAIPSHLLWEPMMAWLKQRRRLQLALTIHQTYSTVARFLTAPFRRSTATIEQNFRTQEREVYQQAILELFDAMRRQRELGDDRIKAAMDQVLSGANQEHLFAELLAEYDALPLVSDAFRHYVHEVLDDFATSHPTTMTMLQSILWTTAAIRPVFTIGIIALPGAGFAFDFVVTDVIGNVVVDNALTAVGAEVLAEGGHAMLQHQLLGRIVRGYYAERTARLGEIIKARITGPMLQDIDRFADVTSTEPFVEATTLIVTMRSAVHAIPGAEGDDA
jgi:ribosome biogenesis GTPase A